MALWALDTVHLALTIAGAYKYIIAGLENPLTISSAGPELIFQLLLTPLVALPAQGFFVYRIYIFSDKNILTPVIWVPLAIYQLVTALIYVVKTLYIDSNGLHVVDFRVLSDRFLEVIATSTLAVAAAVDVMTTVILTFMLFRKRNSTVYSRTAHILQRLAMFAINTGLWTAVFALLAVIVLQIYPGNVIYVVFAVPLCSVYCNTLLANLNARGYIRGEMTTQNVDLQLSGSFHFKTNPQPGETGSTPIPAQHSEDYRGAKFLEANRSTESHCV